MTTLQRRQFSAWRSHVVAVHRPLERSFFGVNQANVEIVTVKQLADTPFTAK